MTGLTGRQPVALIVGASRGLGWGLAREYLRGGWQVIATVRDPNAQTPLHALQNEAGGRLRIEAVDINAPAEVDALAARLADVRLDLLYVNAGIANDPDEKVGDVSTQTFQQVMLTNALSPLRVVERFADRVVDDGRIAVMSSELGSVADNVDGGWEVYRASKAALNSLMRSVVARRAGDTRTWYVIAPGWVRTAMGTDAAPLDIDTSIAGVVRAIDARRGTRGLVFVNYRNEILPW
ncbi:SDR family NAD(P)-dependent oxidoreductase [Paraburkholderia caballeronis]|uniref:SDR family NAD(P)-dependent oxidoreductase n=1 Tax=Paraburkholderia caballeronis TaxID=416943 RepID=UPI0010648382|nr:SDR family NAD(P)-dependent oxidoreductase [Paraburkholderia caballeronis]TDV09522.1 NAD(P)-dependent dehydrogenase (short-subunit alcohol dehydrogenase family) [Paraburkholderia caballeronis]TDV13793.1 NAD(P)-dependent dehydrogenase (short-subunit alcohol dehydrogenase family) [Paraburkholderia caballeronis]TDV22975.1 NAD(P)-dependent dehydrogenase (short-subunit alcohol dehydrogenase family) [Paraburkholderia caballeronis]